MLHIIFDYDYTLFDKNNIELSMKLLSLTSKLNTEVSLLTGNDKKNLINIEHFKYIISNQGNYDVRSNKYIQPSLLLSTKDKEIISKFLENYYDKDISICSSNNKNRDELYEKLILIPELSSYKILKTGKTSIEIMKKEVSKLIGYEYIKSLIGDDKTILYITDIDDIPELKINKIIISSMEWLYDFLIKNFI